MAVDIELQDKISELREKGFSYDKIGDMVGTSGAMIWKVAHGKCSSQTARVYFGLSLKPIPVVPSLSLIHI